MDCLAPLSRLCLPVGLLVASGAASAAEYRNALIIVLDDVGVDKVGAYAGDADNPTETRPSTPTLDLVAEAGVRFTDAWASPVCSPTRAMLLTGEAPYRTGIGDALYESSTNRLQTSPDTLQQLASASGLATGMFGKWHLGETSGTPDAPTTRALNLALLPIRTGFDWFEGSSNGAVTSYSSYLYERSVPDASRSSGYATTAETVTTTTVTDRTTEDALAWMSDRAAAGEPRLTVVAYHLAHDIDGSWDDPVTACGGTPAYEVGNFRVVMECLDDEIAELIAGTPDLEETLVVILGDNGTSRDVTEGNFHDSRGKGTIYENGIRVPLLIAGGDALADVIDLGAPSETATYPIDVGTTATDPASVVDIYATVADLLDLQTATCTVPDTCGTDSISLRSVLTGGAAARDTVWTESYREDASGNVYGEGAIRWGDFKLIARVEDVPSPCREYEVYDLVADRWEVADLFHDAAYVNERTELLALVEAQAERAAGSAGDWLSVADCESCSATETWYDGVDGDCVGGSDYDQDGDGLDAFAYGGTDCDDTDAAALPDPADLDCDGLPDGDLDGDGHLGLDLGGADCDDTDPAVNPDALETWYDGVDQDCDGADDFDQDADGYPSIDWGGTDCGDTNAAINAAALEVWYDGVDQNCDGRNDFDRDGDGYTALAWGGTDCADRNAARYPGRGC